MQASHCCCLPVKVNVLTSQWGGQREPHVLPLSLRNPMATLACPGFGCGAQVGPHPMSLHASTDTMAQPPPPREVLCHKGPKAANGGLGGRKRPGGTTSLQKLSHTRDEVTPPAALVPLSWPAGAASHRAAALGSLRDGAGGSLPCSHALHCCFPSSPPGISHLPLPIGIWDFAPQCWLPRCSAAEASGWCQRGLNKYFRRIQADGAW